MARRHLCVPGTSAPVERLFSYSGYIMRPHRAKLTSEHLKQATLMRCNASLIEGFHPKETEKKK